MTGIILKLFPNICTAKETYFSASERTAGLSEKHGTYLRFRVSGASYWQELAYTLERDTTRYFHSGACRASPHRSY